MKRLLLVLFTTACALGAGSLTPTGLRCEYAVNPLGIDVVSPRLSWRLESNQRDAAQTAYQVLVASSPEKLKTGTADLWDSGKVISGRSIQVNYKGVKLASRQRCHWKVRVWDKSGQASEYSAPASWEIGLLTPKDWDAEWIGYPAGWNSRALYFRRDVDLKQAVRIARVYVAGLGYYELRLNGAKVGDHVLDPGFTAYSKRVLYATYDVTGHLRSGRNALGVIVGAGWYGTPSLLLQMEVTYQDGSSELFSTNGVRGNSRTGWRVTGSPIVANSIYDGETYDARLEKTGWDEPGGEAKMSSNSRTERWSTVMPVEPPGGRLVAQSVNPIKVVDSIRPVAMNEPKPGIFVYDTGQNMAGWAQLRVNGTSGTRVTLKFAESLNDDGTLNQQNLRAAAATDVYILKGGGEEVWQPRFTYHGFRYVQVEGFPGKPSIESVTAKVVRSSVDPNGSFESSNALLNRIQRMIWSTEASNLHSVPTDCPQRDERMGWMNDLTVRLEESVYNFDLARFYSKFLNDVSDTQTADGAIADTAPFKWGKRPADPVSASYLLMAHFLHQHYGDTRVMAEHFDGFKAWVEFLASRSRNHIVTYGYYGDWCPPQAFGNGPRSKETPVELMSTGYLYYCSRLLADMARVLGRPVDEKRYTALAQQVGQAFNRDYWKEATGGYGANNQSANSFALFLGVVPEQRVARVVANLAADVERQGGHLTTGNLCTKYLMEALTTNGHADAAYRIATQETYPSWGYMLSKGATTLWERWEHMTGGAMNSHNHPMMGSVSSWFYKYLAGIQADPRGPGFKRFVIHPYPVEGLKWVRASYTSMYGVIRSSWRKEKGRLVMNVTVPVNATATVFVPGQKPQEIGSGDYEFVSR